MLRHSLAFPLRRIAGPEGRPDRQRHTPFRRQGGNFGQRHFEVLVNVVAQRLERRDVDDLRLVGQVSGERLRTRGSMAVRKAARVFPEPVGAEISVVLPARICGQPNS